MDQDPQSKAKIVILLLVCLVFSVVFAYILTQQQSVLIRSDYFARWYATQKLVTENRSLYDPQNGREVDSLNGFPNDPIAGNFFYPANVALLILPLVGISFPLAHFIWLVVIQSFFIVAILLISRIEKWPHSSNHLAFFLLLSVFFIPSLQNTIWGQFNTISVISLALVYLCLRSHYYGLAGICALGLTLKPQAMLLTIVFLLVWAISGRHRWSFIISLGLVGLAAWGLAEWIEPNWVNKFFDWLQIYTNTYHPQAMLEAFGLSGSVLNILLILFSLGLSVWNRSFPADSAPFAGTLVFSLSIWCLAGAVIGMMNMVALPLALMWLFPYLEKTQPALYRFALIFYLALYFLGLAGFIYGLTRPELYGLHTQLSELAYKIVAPIMTAVLAIPLCLAGRPLPIMNLFRRKEAL